jgi:hypothetical protein
MRFAFACGPCDRQSAATLLTFVLPYLQHWWQTKPALPGSNARSATDLHNAHKLTYMGSLKLLFMCSNANQNCERIAASSSFPIFVAGLTAVDEQVKEATCILFSALAQHASLHQPLLQAGVLMPLLAILHSRSSRTQELATAILLQLGQGQLGREILLHSSALYDLAQTLPRFVSATSRRRAVRLMELLVQEHLSQASGETGGAGMERFLPASTVLLVVRFVCVDDCRLQFSALQTLCMLATTYPTFQGRIARALLVDGLLAHVVARISSNRAELALVTTKLVNTLLGSSAADSLVSAGLPQLLHPFCSANSTHPQLASACAISMFLTLTKAGGDQDYASAAHLTRGVFAALSRSTSDPSSCAQVCASFERHSAIEPVLFFLTSESDSSGLQGITILHALCGTEVCRPYIGNGHIARHFAARLVAMMGDFDGGCVALLDDGALRMYHTAIRAASESLAAFTKEDSLAQATKVVAAVTDSGVPAAVASFLATLLQQFQGVEEATATVQFVFHLVHCLCRHGEQFVEFFGNRIQLFLAMLGEQALLPYAAHLLAAISARRSMAKVFTRAKAVVHLTDLFVGQSVQWKSVPSSIYRLLTNLTAEKRNVQVMCKHGLLAYICDYFATENWAASAGEARTDIPALFARLVHQFDCVCNRILLRAKVVRALVRLLHIEGDRTCCTSAARALAQYCSGESAVPLLVDAFATVKGSTGRLIHLTRTSAGMDAVHKDACRVLAIMGRFGADQFSGQQDLLQQFVDIDDMNSHNEQRRDL